MNRFSGTIKREYQGKTLTLVMDFNAAIHFEQETGSEFFETVESWGDEGSNPPIPMMRAFIHAALQEHHEDLTLKDAGRLLSGDIDIVKDLSAATTANAKAPGEDEAGADKGKKRKAA